jgi:hypothetical protein
MERLGELVQRARLERRRRLSGEEIRIGGQRNPARAGRSQPEPHERNLNWTRNDFTNLDHNRDGR